MRLQTQIRLASFALFGVAIVATLALAKPPAREAEPPNALVILSDAFQYRFDVDLTSEIELVMHDRGGREHRRVFDAASKLIDGRLHSVGKLNWPHYLRNMTILTIEAEDRDHDAFVYLPTLGRVRRVSSAQKGDSFFGTDVTYEDLERRKIEDFEILELEATHTQGESSFRIRARPRRRMTYAGVDYFVAAADHALLEMLYYKENEEKPFRVITSPRETMLVKDGHIVPTQITVRNLSRQTTTTATFNRLVLDPKIDDRLFSVTILERNPALRNYTHGQIAEPASGSK